MKRGAKRQKWTGDVIVAVLLLAAAALNIFDADGVISFQAVLPSDS